MAFEIKKLGKLLDMGSDALHGTNVVGIDIGTSSIKVVSLTEGKTGAALETYGEMQLGPYAGLDIGRATNLEPGPLGGALVDILKEANVTASQGALAIPHSASFVAITNFPATDPEQLASMVPLEARKRIPMAMNEVTLDWFVIPDRRPVLVEEGVPAPKSGTPVLLAAIYNEALKRYRTVVQRAGLAIAVNEIESFSVIRSSVHEDETTVMVLDLGATSTKMYVIQDGILHETHRMPIGGHDLTTAIVGGLQITDGEAEEVKRQFGFVTGVYDPRITAALATPVERIVHEVQRVRERYEKGGSEKITKVVLAGGGAMLKGFREALENALAIPVVLSNPFSKVEYPAFLEATLKEIGPSFAVALGVALRRLAEK
ncbi:MAG: hypothetical protein RLZZ234_167 [Candidatus Parcubacteria bacterium]|jgi:type IV pilus assembly protein PilM